MTEITLYQTSWHGVAAWALESETLRAVVVPAMGAKIVSLYDKRREREWIAGAGERPFKPVTYGAAFEKQDMSGWDEMFPTITACAYPGAGEKHGAWLPDHGEVWTLPWELVEQSGAALKLAVNGKALPYRLTRTATFCAPAGLMLSYQLENLSSIVMPYLWSAHPQFVCPPGTRVFLPSQVIEVINVLPDSWGWGAPETKLAWQIGQENDNDQKSLDRIDSSTLKRARKVFTLPETPVDWVKLQDPTGDWLQMCWNTVELPYFGLWVDEGAISSQAVAAPEPMTGFYDSLALAVKNKRVSVIQPGEMHTWSLTVQIG